MRRFAGLIALVAALFLQSGAAGAEPVPGPGYHASSVRLAGARFSGLARDGDELLVTDLASGRLFRWRSNSGFSAFGPVLPHGPDVIGDPTGPYGLVRAGTNYLVVQGWQPVEGSPAPYDHALLEVDETRVVRILHDDFWNPFRLVRGGDSVYVIDAARNTLERLSAEGQKTRVFAFPRLSLPQSALSTLSPTEFVGAAPYAFDAVPAGLALQDERIYVSLFGGFPFLDGAGKVVWLEDSGEKQTMQVLLEGLNAPVDLAFDENGGLLVLEHGTYRQGIGFTAASGRLLRFDPAGGAAAILLDGLTRPTSVLLLDESRIVVSELTGALVFLSRTEAGRTAGEGGNP